MPDLSRPIHLSSSQSTFFAAMEAQLLSGITPSNPRNATAVQSAADAGLSGALVVHIFAGKWIS
jgi:hypothetical protein